jgi:hypothetical protein
MANWRIQTDLIVEAETSAEAQAIVERHLARLASAERPSENGERKLRYTVGAATRAAASPRQLKPRRIILDPRGPIRSKRSA